MDGSYYSILKVPYGTDRMAVLLCFPMQSFSRQKFLGIMSFLKEAHQKGGKGYAE
jgi:hypothetical protein